MALNPSRPRTVGIKYMFGSTRRWLRKIIKTMGTGSYRFLLTEKLGVAEAHDYFTVNETQS